MAECEREFGYDKICDLTLDEHHEMVKALLPHGRAWPRQNDTTLQRYWRSYASVVKWLEDQYCALIEQFYCNTATSSLNVWWEQYGLPDECDPNGDSLCARVAAQGGGTCDYFVGIGAQLGYAVKCRNLGTPAPRAGCMMTGCATLWPTPEWEGGGSDLGCAQLGDCATAAGDPDDLPGEFPESQFAPASISLYAGCTKPVVQKPYTGLAHHWEISIDVDAALGTARVCEDFMQTGCNSFAGEALGKLTDTDIGNAEYPQAGCMQTGCSYLCSPDWQKVFCFIERYKPAHTVLVYAFH